MFEKDKTEKISVVIATYNGSQTIEETLKSCFSQSELPKEVIIVDDASTDDTVDIVKKFDFRGIPVKIIENRKNFGGPAKPFNTGIACATGSLIATLEQDDLWHRDKLTLSRKAFESLPEAGLVYSDNESFENKAPKLADVSIDKAVLPRLIPADEAVKLAMEKQFTLSLSNMVFRKPRWKAAGGLPEKFKICTDYNFLVRLLRAGCRVAHIPETLVYYRVHPKSVWLTSDYIRRNLERYSAVDSLCRAFPRLVEPRIREEAGSKIFDIAYKSAATGKCFQAIRFYLWSLRYGVLPAKVFRSIARVLIKLAFRKEYE